MLKSLRMGAWLFTILAVAITFPLWLGGRRHDLFAWVDLLDGGSGDVFFLCSLLVPALLMSVVQSDPREPNGLNPLVLEPDGMEGWARFLLASAGEELSQVLRMICEEACLVLDADHSMVEKTIFENSEARKVDILASCQMPPSLFELLRDCNHPNNLLLDVVQKGEIEVFRAEESGQQMLGETHWECGDGTICLIPLSVEGRPFGALLVCHLDDCAYGPEERRIARWLGDLASLAIERKLAIDEEQRRTKLLDVITQICRLVGATLEPEELFRRVIQSIRNAVPCERCLLGGIEPGEESFQVWGMESDFEVQTKSPDDPALREWLLKEIYEPRTSRNISDLRETPLPWTEHLEEAGVRSLLIVPISQGDSCCAHLTLFSTRPSVFSSHDERFLNSLSAHLAMAIHNAVLYRKAEGRASRLSVINRIAKSVGSTLNPDELFRTIVSEIRKVIPCERCVFSILTEGIRSDIIVESDIEVEWDQKSRISDMASWVREAYEKKEGRIVPDIRELDEPRAILLSKAGFRSVLSAPILLGDAGTAHLVLSSTRMEAFTQDDLDLLTSSASYLGPAIGNARLFGESRRRADRMAALNELSQQISENLSLNEVLQRVVSSAVNLLGGDFSLLYMMDSSTDEAVLKALYGASPDTEVLEVEKTKLRKKSFFLGNLLNSKEGILISDTDSVASPKSPDSPIVKLGAQSFIAVPFLQDGRYIGHVNCLSKEKNFFEEEDLKLLEALAAQANVAIQNARLLEETARSRNFLQSVLSDSAEAILSANLSGELILWNEAAESLFGYSQEEALGKSLNLVIPEEGAEEARDRTATVKRTGRAEYFETLRKRKDGSLILVGVTLSPVKDGDGNLTAISGIFKDLTEQKRNEEEIRKLNEELEAKVLERTAKLEHKSEQIARLNEINRNLSSLLSVEEVLGMIVHAAEELIPGASPNVYLYREDRSGMSAVAGDVSKDPANEEVFLKRGEGLAGWTLENRESVYITKPKADPRWVDKPWSKEKTIGAVAMIPLAMGKAALGVLACFRDERKEWDLEEKELLESFASQAAVAIHNAQLLDEVRENNRELEKTLHELEQAQSQLVASEKLASLGGLVAGIAHEINTPVGIGVTAASHLQDKTREFRICAESGRIRRSDLDSYLATSTKSAHIILENLQRASELIKSFKQVAVDQSSVERRTFDLGEYIHEILASLQPRLKRTEHKITVDCGESLVITSFPGPISQIVTNFVMNSLKHAFENEDEGEISISARHEDGEVRLFYTDNGKGMDESCRRRIFDPFFTTKRSEGGSGLGMHIVYNLVTQTLGGIIACFSEPGIGTEFLITIPVD